MSRVGMRRVVGVDGRLWAAVSWTLLRPGGPFDRVRQSSCFVRACFIAGVGILFLEGNFVFLVEWGEDLSLERTLVGPGLSILLIALPFLSCSLRAPWPYSHEVSR